MTELQKIPLAGGSGHEEQHSHHFAQVLLAVVGCRGIHSLLDCLADILIAYAMQLLQLHSASPPQELTPVLICLDDLIPDAGWT
jgi:hypothetical protein